MKLSVILPCYNGAATIAVQLEALTIQEYSDWEVIVVNNGSTDASMSIVEQYRDRLPGLRMVEAYPGFGPRLGVPHSYNTGIQAATGDAFVFCEADDEVAPGWLAAMGRALMQHHFVAARLEHRKLNAEWLHPLEDDGQQADGLSCPNFPPYLPYASGCSFGMRRSLYEQVGELSIDFPCVHDVEYCWRAQMAGFSLHFVPDAIVHYREKSQYRDMLRQGRNWGRDFTLILKYYRCPIGRFAHVRKLKQIVLHVLNGPRFYLLQKLGTPNSQAKLATWVWGMGWLWGEFQGILQQTPQSQLESPISHVPLEQPTSC